MEFLLAPAILLLFVGGRFFDDGFRNSERYSLDGMLARTIGGAGSMLAGLILGAFALRAW